MKAQAPRKRAQAKAKSGQAPTTDSPTVNQDDYLSKIAKYVPAETIAIATLGFGVWEPKGNWIWFWLGVGAVANVIYLFSTSLRLPSTTPPPRLYFYGLSALAFFAWAIATIPAAKAAAHVTDQQKAGFVLAGAAFLIPALDTILSAYEWRRVNAASTTADTPANAT